MHLPSNAFVRRLQTIIRKSMYVDRAVLLKTIKTGVFDDNNTETVETIEIPMECSFTDKVSSENWTELTDARIIDAEIRFEGHDPVKGDKIRLTGRFETISYPNKVMEIVAIANRDAFGFVCALKAVEL